MKLKKSIYLALFFLFLFFSGCSFNTLTEAGRTKATQAAFSTVFSEMTTQAFLNPTSTETPMPTATYTATLTQLPSLTPTLESTATFTPSPTVPLLKAKVLYAAAFPENKSEFEPNEHFGIAIGFENIGSVPWGAGSKLLHVGYDGEYVTVQTEAAIDHVVNPGEKYEFSLWAFGSEDMSYQNNYFQLYNEFGVPIQGGYAVYGYQPK